MSEFASDARMIAERSSGMRVKSIERFTTGAAHFVYDVRLENDTSLVVRMTSPDLRSVCAGAAFLSGQLRSLGVPLPRLLYDGSRDPIPHLILERLPGTDLGKLLDRLPDHSLRSIVLSVVNAQRSVASIPTAGRFGYAVRAQDAPHETWSGVIRAHLDRSHRRILAAKLFDPGNVTRVACLVNECEADLAGVPATPFLHDTTTKNVIVGEDGTFSGIVDVDDLCFGDPRYVIALTVAASLSSNHSMNYVDYWLEKAGFAKDRLFWLYVAAFIVDLMSVHGHTFNGNEHPSSPAQRRHLEATLANVTSNVC